jgi:hypothetical protein
MADKHLAKALKKDEKRKLEAKKEKEKDKPKRRMGYRGIYRPPQAYGYGGPNAYMQGAQGPAAPNPHVSGPQANYGRPEPKNCSNCKQMGHYFRNCPYRTAPSAAAGAPPK